MKILITGGASGLGSAITKMLAGNEQNELLITYHASKDKALMLEKDFSTVKSIQVDFNSPESIELLIQAMKDIQPDVLVNNAITSYTEKHFHKIDSTEFEKSFSSNVVPTLKITQQFISNCRKRKYGKIITILTSYILNKPPVGLSEYVANKEYLRAMSKSWAIENTSFGITSNCISPSFMETNLTRNTDSRLIETMINDNPNKALLQGSEVAEVVLFLINATSQINGSNIVMNAAKDLI